MHTCGIAIWTMSILLVTSAFAANPFLDAPNDKPLSAKFRGTEWSDDIGEEDTPLTGRVVTTRLAKMPRGRDLQDRIYRFEVTRRKTPRNSARVLYRG
jgi:hypothetical protein